MGLWKFSVTNYKAIGVTVMVFLIWLLKKNIDHQSLPKRLFILLFILL